MTDPIRCLLDIDPVTGKPLWVCTDDLARQIVAMSFQHAELDSGAFGLISGWGKRIAALEQVNRDNFAQMAAMAETFAKLTGFCATTDEAKRDPPAEAQGCKAASEAIRAVCRSLTSCYDDPDLADAILAAIRRGDVPLPEDAPQIARLRAELEQAKREDIPRRVEQAKAWEQAWDHARALGFVSPRYGSRGIDALCGWMAELARERNEALGNRNAWQVSYERATAERDSARAEVAQWKERAEKAEESQRLTQKAREDDRGRLQQKCSDWGTYWRAEDAHGVNLTTAQAAELLQEALGVEVEIKTGRDSARAEADALRAEVAALKGRKVTLPLRFRYDDHDPQLHRYRGMGYNLALDHCAAVIRAAGIEVAG